MSIKLEPNTWYITAGGYAVFIEKTVNGAFAATIETSPDIYSNGGTVKEAYNGKHGWLYRYNGISLFLAPEWKEKLQIVEKAPFSSLPDLPKGYRFKDGFARLSPTKDGEFFLSSDGYSVILADGNEFAYHHNFGTKRFILEKEPAQYTELKAGDVLRPVQNTQENIFQYVSWTPELKKVTFKDSKDLEEMTSTDTFEHNGVTYYYLRKGEVLKEGDIIKQKDGLWSQCYATIGDLACLKNFEYARPVGTYRPLKIGDIIQDGDEYFYNYKWVKYNTAIGKPISYFGLVYSPRRPITNTQDLALKSEDAVSSSLTQKENVMTELMNKTTPLAKSALSLCWRVVKNQANYWLFEPTKDVVSRVMRSVRYITLFSAIGAGTYAYNYPQEAKDLAMKCLPKIQVSFEKPEILN